MNTCAEAQKGDLTTHVSKGDSEVERKRGEGGNVEGKWGRGEEEEGGRKSTKGVVYFLDFLVVVFFVDVFLVDLVAFGDLRVDLVDFLGVDLNKNKTRR